MENSNGFERFSKAWKKSGATDSSNKIYAEKDIKAFKMKKSKDFSIALNRSIVFDIVQKSILLVAMLLLIWFYWTNQVLIITIILLIGLSAFLTFKELSIKKELNLIDDYSRSIGDTIKEKASFFRSHFPSLQWMMSFTNGLLVWIGSLFYFYSKYGYYRIDDIYDILVNLIMVGCAVGISFFSYNYHYRAQLLELEENLLALNDETSAAQHIQMQKRKKRRYIIGLIILIVMGLLLFIMLIISYMKQLV